MAPGNVVVAVPRVIESLVMTRVVSVAAGGFFSLVLTAEGHLYSFGYSCSRTYRSATYIHKPACALTRR